MEFSVRTITPDDAEAAAELSGQLGYPADAKAMRQRIADLLSEPGRVVYVACVHAQAVAWIDVTIVSHLQAEKRAEIGGLVVSESFRGSGIGHKLLACAERWAREQGVKQMLVRSRHDRERAHKFYLRDGYAQTKTSAVFTKPL